MDTLIAMGSTSANSSAQTLEAGERATVVITGEGYAYIDVQGVGGTFGRHGGLSTNAPGRNAFQIEGRLCTGSAAPHRLGRALLAWSPDRAMSGLLLDIRRLQLHVQPVFGAQVAA